MKTRILAGTDTEEQTDLLAQWEASRRLRRRLTKLLQDDIDTIHASMRTEDTMTTASWPYVQAAKIGEIKALLKIISLFE
jgi:hypothetical protein